MAGGAKRATCATVDEFDEDSPGSSALLFAAVGTLVNGCGVAGIDSSIVVSRFIFPTLIWSAFAGGKAALAEGYSTLDCPVSRMSGHRRRFRSAVRVRSFPYAVVERRCYWRLSSLAKRFCSPVFLLGEP